MQTLDAWCNTGRTEKGIRLQWGPPPIPSLLVLICPILPFPAQEHPLPDTLPMPLSRLVLAYLLWLVVLLDAALAGQCKSLSQQWWLTSRRKHAITLSWPGKAAPAHRIVRTQPVVLEEHSSCTQKWHCPGRTVAMLFAYWALFQSLVKLKVLYSFLSCFQCNFERDKIHKSYQRHVVWTSEVI